MLRLENLRFAYGETLAVDGIDLHVGKGETFGLLGPNGAGKTTTIHLMTGVLTPAGGRILFDGSREPSNPSVRSLFGVSPQALALYEELTGEENMAFFGKLYGLKGNMLKERVGATLAFAGLESRAKDRVKTYSGGMKRRLNMACGLVHDPQIIFMDEPTVGVDPQSRNHIFEKIESLASIGRTIVYTTHYMEEAQKLCDRVAIMDQGKIIALDTVDGLISAHGGAGIVEVECSDHDERLESYSGTWEMNTCRITTEDPIRVAGEIASKGVDYISLRIHRPDLESVFLNLTGRRLRE